MRNYEILFLADPRLTDEEVVAITDEAKGILTSGGGAITKEESWGKKKMAYQIEKLSEAYYVLLNVEINGDNPFPELERRLQQNDKILRYMTVRLDAGRLRTRPPREGAAAQTAEKEES